MKRTESQIMFTRFKGLSLRDNNEQGVVEEYETVKDDWL